MTQSAGNISGSFVTTGGNWKGGEWGIQATSEKIIVNPGVEYTYSADISASKDMVVRIQFGETVEEIQVKAGEKKTYKKNFKAEQKVFDFIAVKKCHHKKDRHDKDVGKYCFIFVFQIRQCDPAASFLLSHISPVSFRIYSSFCPS